MMRIHNNEENENDYTVVELKESKSSEGEDQIINLRNQNVNEIFDLSFANNYLILISYSENVVLEDINKEDYYNNKFSFVGYITSKEKSNVLEIPKALIMTNYNKLKRYLKKDWTSCYVRPIEKITTFLRH